MRQDDPVNLKVYCGDTLRSNSQPPETIVENFLWKQDAVMLLGSEKAGKSILAQQLFASIVSNRTFLDKYEVKCPGPVVYIQTEGKRDEFVDRLNNMCMGIDGFDDNLFLHIYRKYCPLNVPMFKKAIIDTIKRQSDAWGMPPVAICIDSLYKAMDGDLTNNRDVIAFTNAVDELITEFKSGIVIIHHDSKEWRDKEDSN